MRRKPVLFLLLLCCFFQMSTLVSAENKPFQDVNETNRYYEDIGFVTERGIMNGDPSQKFSPNNDLTRAETAVLITNLANIDLYGYDGETPFGDVSPDAWYAKSVQWLAENDLIAKNNAFRPNDRITKEELSKILYCYEEAFAPVDNKISNVSFEDEAMISPWAEKAATGLCEKGIFETTPSFEPKASVSRGEAAAIITDYCENLIVGKKQTVEGIEVAADDMIVYQTDLITSEEELYEQSRSEENINKSSRFRSQVELYNDEGQLVKEVEQTEENEMEENIGSDEKVTIDAAPA